MPFWPFLLPLLGTKRNCLKPNSSRRKSQLGSHLHTFSDMTA
jgi:hypothetical protein